MEQQLQAVPRPHRSVFAVLALHAPDDTRDVTLLDMIVVGLPHPAGDDSPSAAAHAASEHALDVYRRPVELRYLDSFRATLLLRDEEREVMRRIWQATVTQRRPFTVTADDRSIGYSQRLQHLGVVRHVDVETDRPQRLELTLIGETLLDQIGYAAPVLTGSALSGSRRY